MDTKKFTVDLTEEDRQGLDRIIAYLSKTFGGRVTFTAGMRYAIKKASKGLPKGKESGK